MIRIVYLNARSLVSKLSDLEILLNDYDPDLVLIAETWCNSEITNSMLGIKGYFIEPDLRVDRNDTLNGIGGGLIVYVKNSLIVKPIDQESTFNMFTQFEIICKDDIKNNLTITLVYRPPSAPLENTEELCKLLEKSGPNSSFIGDFNFPSIDWIYETSDNKSINFLQSTKNLNYEQFVDFQTHVRGNILDLVLTNRPENILSVESIGNLSNSDHSIILTEVLFNPKINKSTELVQDWKNGDCEGLTCYLQNVKWIENMENKSTDEAWTFFKTTITSGIEKFIPKIPRRGNGKPQWMTKTVRKLVRMKQRHYNIYMKSRTDINLERLKKTQKDCKKAIRGAKKQFEQNIAKNANKRTFNSYIKSRTKSRANVGPLKVGSNIFTDPKQIATILNNSFCSVFSKENTQITKTCPIIPSTSQISDIYFTVRLVQEKISKLKSNSAPGPDGITPRFLKDHSDILSIPLSIIFNKSMYTSTVPKDWKDANVTPIFKKGAKSSPDNYRPISLTSVPCKIMESIMRDKMVDHLLVNKLIQNSQHGFMQKKSCTTNLLEFLENVTENLDRGVPMDIVYLDFSKAFDKVPRLRLLEKIKAHSINGRLLKWIENWLTNRQQRVVLNGSYSEWSKVESGVPQGSVLGPLAFVIFINDLDDCIKQLTIVNKFADDTKLGHRIESDQDRETLQRCIDNLLIWAEDWCMEFNVKKCKVMHVGRNNPNCEYIMAGTVLLTVSKERDRSGCKPRPKTLSAMCRSFEEGIYSSRSNNQDISLPRQIYFFEVIYSICPMSLRVCGPDVVTLDWTGY